MAALASMPAAETAVYLQGVHVSHWKPRGQRLVLFLSYNLVGTTAEHRSSIGRSCTHISAFDLESRGSINIDNFGDMEPDGWEEMICVEPANVADNAIRLASRESH